MLIDNQNNEINGQTAPVGFRVGATSVLTTMTAASNVFTPNCNLGNEFDCGTITAASTIANPINPPKAGFV